MDRLRGGEQIAPAPVGKIKVSPRGRHSMSSSSQSHPVALLSDSESRRLLAMPDTGVLSVDTEGCILDANAFLGELLLYSPQELKGKPLWKIFGSTHPDAARKVVQRLHHDGYVPSSDLPLKSKDGIRIHFEFRRLGRLPDNAELIECQFHDLEVQSSASEAPGADEKIQCHRFMGLCHLEGRANLEIARTRDHRQPLSLLSIGIDRDVDNNNASSRLLLRRFSRACSGELRSDDVIGKVDAKTFVALLPGTPAKGALRTAERIRTAVAQMQAVASHGRSRNVTVSIGAVTTRTGRASYGQLRSRADAKRDDAMSSGGNRVNA